MDIGSWLRELGLGHLERLLRDGGIGLDVLPELADADLKELGLNLGDRKRLMKAIAALGAEPSPGPGEAPAPSTTSRPREAERRQLTVMFVDLVGSTALSQRLDPEDMGQILKAYQNAVVGEISRLDGFTAKLMGDGVLAYFGWPKAHEDEAERAVRAGLAIVAAVAELAAPEPLACRVGIATGLVVVGDLVGEGAAQEEAVVGDTPNLAARLQALAAPGEVVVAEATRRLLGAGFAVESLDAHAVKGLAEPVLAFRVTGERAIESRFASRAGETVAPMVGRDEELALLTRQWREAVAGEGRAVIVVGEAGIGKSRLIRALREAVLPDRPTVLLYQCSPFHADSPLWPVTQQLVFAARFEAGDDASTKRAKLAQFVEPGERLHLLASLLGIPADAEPLAKLDPQERRRRTLQALVDQLLDLTASAPVLVLMEDVHWVDPSTIELLQRTLEAITSRLVLLVMTSRPEAEPKLGSFPHLSRVALSRLGRAAVEAIVGRIVEAQALDAEVRAEILARTDGVPLFVEELTKAILEAAPSGLGVTVPASLQDSLLSRLDRDPTMKSVAQIAACFGREVENALLEAMADLPAHELVRGLEALVRAELVFRRGTPPDTIYSFKHALVREVAYQSLLRTKRLTIHGRIADITVERFPHIAAREPEIVARHLVGAGREGEAVSWLELAGVRATERSASNEAVAQFRTSIEILGRQPECEESWRVELRLRLMLGSPLMMVRGYGADEVGANYRRARELASALGDRDALFPVLYGMWAFSFSRNQLSDCLLYASELLDHAEQARDRSAIMAGLRLRGLTRITCGDLRAGLADVVEVRRLYDSQIDGGLVQLFAQDQLVASLMAEAWALFSLGYPDQGLVAAQASVKRAVEIGHAHSHAYALGFSLAWTHVLRREFAAAAAAGESALAIGRTHNFPTIVALGGLAHAVALALSGHLAEVPAAGIEASLAYDRIGGKLQPGLTGFAIATVRLALGEFVAARAAGDEALMECRASGNLWMEAALHLLLADLARIDGAMADAERALFDALDVARRQEARSWELRASTSLARLWADAGERRRAQDLLDPIYGWFTEGFDTPDLVEAKALLEELA